MFNKDKKFLTEKNGVGGFELKICMSCDPGENNEKCGLCQFMQDAVERLGEYEATGLSPKEVSEIKRKKAFYEAKSERRFKNAKSILGVWTKKVRMRKASDELAKKGVPEEAEGKKLPVFDMNDPDCGEKIEKFFEEGKREQ